jgi:DNA-binding SARP family transcriptional activator
LAATRTRGITAAILLATAIVGLPIALAETIGDPIHQWPTLSSGQLTDTGVIAILATVFWLAWLSFIIPAGLEIGLAVVAHATRHPQRQIRLPLLGAQQDLARNLISAVLLLLPAASTAIASAAPASHQPVHLTSPSLAAETHHHRTTTTVVDNAPATNRYVIPVTGGMRSYWALADHFLGDGARWREIWRINEGRVHADGTVMDSPRQLHAGWTILIPTENEHHDPPSPTTPSLVTVKPGDTLSGIAATDGARNWQELWRLNADRAEPGQKKFTDPNLIRPGWTITLPDADGHRGTPAAAPNGLPQAGPKSPTAPRRHRPPTEVSPHDGRPAGQSPQQSPADELTEPPSAPTSRAASPTAAASRDAHDLDHGEHRFPVVPLGIGLAALTSVAVLDRARRIAQRRRRIGHRPLPPPRPLRDVEARIRRDARRAHPTIAAINLAASLAGAHPTTVRGVVVHDDGTTDLHLEHPIPVAPPPFVEISTGWRLPSDAIAFALASTDPDTLDDPYPLLVPLGSNGDGQLLLNLSGAGPVSIAGDHSDVEEFLCQTVMALHAAPWADRVQVHVLPEFGKRLGRLERITLDDDLAPQPPVGAPTTLDGADCEGEEPGWRTRPVHLFCGWTADADLSAILQAAGEPARNVHLLAVGAHTDTTTWTLAGDQLVVPDVSDPITVTRSPQVTTTDVEALLRHTETAPDLPVGDPRLADAGEGDESIPAVISERTGSLDQLVQPRLRLLGPVELDGTGRLPRSQVLNLLTLLALHPRGVDRHQLLAALWPDQSVNLQTMRNRIRETRRLVDGGITDGPIWRLDETVTTDWDQFKALSAGDIDHQRRALDLIRGRPFEGLDDADWIDLGGFRSEVEAAIVDVALTVTEHDLATENYAGALTAARAGLQASRYEERLHRAGIRAAAAQGKYGLAKTMQQEMRRVLDIDVEPEDQIQPETLSLVRELRDRRPVASDTPGS